MSGEISIVSGLQFYTWGSSGKMKLDMTYKHGREGANMKYMIYAEIYKNSSSYFNDRVSAQIWVGTSESNRRLICDQVIKSGSSWPGYYNENKSIIETFNNITTQRMYVWIRLWDSQGSASFDKSYGPYELIVDPAGAQLSFTNSTRYINALKVSLSNTIVGDVSKYTVKYNNVETEYNLSPASTSFDVMLTGLTPNHNYSGEFQIKGFANNVYGNYLTLSATDDKLKTYSEPTINISNNILITSQQTISLSSFNGISKFSSTIFYIKNNTEYALNNSSSSNVVVSDSTSLSSSFSLDNTQKNTLLSQFINNTDLLFPCRIKTTITLVNGGTYSYSNDFNYKIDTTYGPSYNASKISYADINNTTLSLTGDSSIIIKGYSSVTFTLQPMTINNNATGNKYLVTCGSSGGGVNYVDSSTNVSLTLNAVDSNQFSVQAIDSRNLSSLVTSSFSTYIDYYKVYLTSQNINRNNGVDKNLKINIVGKFLKWTGLQVNNTIESVKLYYKIAGGGAFSNFITITNGQYTISGDTITINDLITTGNLFDTENAYDLRLDITDKLSTTSTTFYIDSGKPLIWKDKANSRIGINKKPSYTIDIDGDVDISGYIKMKEVNILQKNTGGATLIGSDGHNIVFRPNTTASTTGQVTVDTAGKLTSVSLSVSDKFLVNSSGTVTSPGGYTTTGNDTGYICDNQAATSPRKVKYTVSGGGRAGIYDMTNAEWIVMSEPNKQVKIPHDIYTNNIYGNNLLISSRLVCDVNASNVNSITATGLDFSDNSQYEIWITFACTASCALGFRPNNQNNVYLQYNTDCRMTGTGFDYYNRSGNNDYWYITDYVHTGNSTLLVYRITPAIKGAFNWYTVQYQLHNCTSGNSKFNSWGGGQFAMNNANGANITSLTFFPTSGKLRDVWMRVYKL